MSNTFQSLMTVGARDLLATAGIDAELVRGAAGPLPCRCVYTASSGSIEAALGGSLYLVNGHAVLSAEARPGDHLVIDGSRYLVLSSLRSPLEQVWRCSLSLCK